MSLARIRFMPLDKSVSVEAGCSLLEAALEADISINNICGGDGICGRCKMVVKKGKVGGGTTGLLSREEIMQGVVLACQSSVEGDLVVEIPQETRARRRVSADEGAERFRALVSGVAQRKFEPAPLVTKVALRLEPPTLENNLPDHQRLERAIERSTGISPMQMGLKIMRQLSEIIRESELVVTATVGRRADIAEVMEIEPGDTSEANYMAVVDIGTSTVVVHLVDAVRMSTVDARACFNSQSVYGREVTARIIAAEKKGGEELQRLVVEDINRLVSSLASEHGVRPRDITAVVCAGNTTMMHLLLGLPAGNLRREPYCAVTVEPPPIRAAEVGIKINPRGLLFSIPGVGAWVGGDLTAGILAAGLHEADEIGMLIDIGTNGEIVIGNKEWLIATSASAGPALEGASAECGMMAEKGAIERVYLEGGRLRWEAIGGGPPEGICGSGMIDLVAVLLEKGVIDRAGKFIEGSSPALKFERGLGRFVLAEAPRASKGKAVYITQDEIDNVITAKAAIFAATNIILDSLKLKLSDVKTLFIAGGFGSYINRENAVRIGLLPDLPIECMKYVGNTSIWGAKLAAFSHEAYAEMRRIRRKTTYYDLMGTSDYVEQFKRAMFLPHTDIELFPSLRKRAAGASRSQGAGRG